MRPQMQRRRCARAAALAAIIKSKNMYRAFCAVPPLSCDMYKTPSPSKTNVVLAVVSFDEEEEEEHRDLAMNPPPRSRSPSSSRFFFSPGDPAKLQTKQNTGRKQKKKQKRHIVKRKSKYVRTPFPARAPPALLQAACTRISSLLSCRDSFMSLVFFLPARLRNICFSFFFAFSRLGKTLLRMRAGALNSAEKSVFGSQGQLAPETRKTWPRAFLLHHHHTTQFKPHLMGRANRTSYPRWWPQLSNERHARLLDSWVWWFAHMLQGKQNETEQGGAISAVAPRAVQAAMSPRTRTELWAWAKRDEMGRWRRQWICHM
jgi:hypothetical protein